jgi:hypothetical protein
MGLCLRHIWFHAAGVPAGAVDSPDVQEWIRGFVTLVLPGGQAAEAYCASVLSSHKKRPNPPVNSCINAPRRIVRTSAIGLSTPCPKVSAPEFLARRSRLSDVTDRSHHWIRAIFRQIIHGLKCLAGFRVECHFLGRKRPFLAFWGVG